MLSGRVRHNDVIGSVPDDLKVEFKGAGNRITIGANCRVSRKIVFFSNNQTVRIGDDVKGGMNINLKHDGAGLTIGNGTHVNGQFWASLGEADDVISIGENCLLSRIKMRTSDSHPIFDLATGERINHSKPIHIGNDVWIAEDCLILKGAVIGDGSIIGARSLVAGEVPANCIAAGIPARVIREGVSWREKGANKVSVRAAQGVDRASSSDAPTR